MKLEWHQKDEWTAKGPENHFLRVYRTMNKNTYDVNCTHMDDEGQVQSLPIQSGYDDPQDAQRVGEKWLDDHLEEIHRAQTKKAAK